MTIKDFQMGQRLGLNPLEQMMIFIMVFIFEKCDRGPILPSDTY